MTQCIVWGSLGAKNDVKAVERGKVRRGEVTRKILERIQKTQGRQDFMKGYIIFS